MAIKGGLAKVNLRVTSPLMKGEQVRNAQWLLDHNREKLDFQPGQHDGQYGNHTAAATHRAKFLLGYPKRRVNGNFGPTLYGYLALAGHDHLIPRPKAYQVRGAIRLRLWKRQQAKLHSKRLLATTLALKQLGTKESPPYSNNVKYNTWYYGRSVYGSYPWCAVFASWCFSQVGRSLKYASVSALHWDAAYHRNGLTLTGSPERGDLCCMNFGSADEHVGIFLGWLSGGYFKMVSGNTGLASFANGGEVLVGTFHRSQVDAWVRVN